MKKLLFSLCLLLTVSVVTNQANAQTGFGIRGGVNFANLNNTDGDFDSRTGFMGGVYFTIPVQNSPVVIQPEVLYTQKGYEVGEGAVKLDYIEIPVLAKFNFITNGMLTPNVYFGPAIGFNVSAEDETGLFQGDIEENVNNTEFSIVVGGGLDFGRVDLGVRYGAGLTETFDGGEAKNGVLSITAGLDF